MNRDEYRAFLLRVMQGATVESGGDEVVCKCKYCADKIDHHHMYISIPRSENELSFFNCFLCHSGGVVTYKRLMEWGIFDEDWNLELTRHNANAAKNNVSAFRYLSEVGIYNTVPFNLDNESNRAKLSYINDRLGTNLSIEEATSNGIVLNLIDTLNYNRISTLTRDPRVVKSLSDYFVGFLSCDKNYVNLRRIIEPGHLYEGIDKKYINYNIHGKKDSTLKFITAPTAIDLIKPVKVHVAEGAFDMLSVKYNLRRDLDNIIYGAATGNTYKGFIKYLITMVGIMNMELHLYLDNDDAGRFTLTDLLNEMQVFNFPIFIHYNTIGKDMGVPLSQIKEGIEQIK